MANNPSDIICGAGSMTKADAYGVIDALHAGGFVIVRYQPTAEMIDAAIATERSWSIHMISKLHRAWSAMVKASE